MDDKIIAGLLRDAQKPTDLVQLMDDAATLIEQQSKELQQLRAERAGLLEWVDYEIRLHEKYDNGLCKGVRMEILNRIKSKIKGNTKE